MKSKICDKRYNDYPPSGPWRRGGLCKEIKFKVKAAIELMWAQVGLTPEEFEQDSIGKEGIIQFINGYENGKFDKKVPIHGGNFALKHKQFKKQVRERIHNKIVRLRATNGLDTIEAEKDKN